MTKFIPTEREIKLLEPVRIYTALELAAMPLSKMNAAIEAQEKYYFLEQSTQMGGGCYKNTQGDAGWSKTNSSDRKIKNSLQAKWRVCRASNRQAIGETSVSEFGSVINALLST